jgi:uncharacterized phage protein (TIGR01671 family)
MNREIKFRVWDDVEKKMLYPKDIFNEQSIFYEDDENGNLLINRVIDSYGVRRSLAIQQYTGLKDKHSKEIYEGDIIETIYQSKGSIIYLNEFGGFRIIVNEICLPIVTVRFIDEKPNGLLLVVDKIIGNIFETPELLNKI